MRLYLCDDCTINQLEDEEDAIANSFELDEEHAIEKDLNVSDHEDATVARSNYSEEITSFNNVEDAVTRSNAYLNEGAKTTVSRSDYPEEEDPTIAILCNLEVNAKEVVDSYEVLWMSC